MKTIVEVCAGSVQDCIIAEKLGADRIELNNGLHLGGLTPSYATLILSRRHTTLPIISMVRPRGGGFHYSPIEVETMFLDAQQLLEFGCDGLAFGFLTQDGLIDFDLTQKMVNLCHHFQSEAVFHRAFDVLEDPYRAIEGLIACGVDRILTSGLHNTAIEGTDLLKDLNDQYGDRIELLLGSGLNSNNVKSLIDQTGVNQVHGSFKQWYKDPTTQSDKVSYSYSDNGDYDGVGESVLKAFLEEVR